MNARTHAFRLAHGADLRKGIEHYVEAHDIHAGCIATCIGGLSSVVLRMPGAVHFMDLEADFEIVSAAGTLSVNGSHIHVSISDRNGAVRGGHLDYGSVVRLSAEVVILENAQLVFSREYDPDTGFHELTVTDARSKLQR
ncbi:PPC domain-containing DNA-binding protein [Streptomyces nigra]|uniref:PPC domain-containing DNA-binding protein n=1 Tax=Streptomyces TaxID=1883 RepID=UPI00099F2435|nr:MULTISPECIES: PPC domain-containing DNA-binding protein [unclassified Streptomyces]RDS64408.1 DNA-binding protein [Streptomyces sp. M7]